MKLPLSKLSKTLTMNEWTWKPVHLLSWILTPRTKQRLGQATLFCKSSLKISRSKEQTSSPIHESLAGIFNRLLSEKTHDDNKTTSCSSSNKIKMKNNVFCYK